MASGACAKTSALLVFQKNVRQSAPDLLDHLIEVHLPSGAGRTFHSKMVAVVAVVMQQGSDHQGVNRHPDGASPVRVAAEHAGIGLRRQVGNTVWLAAGMDDVRMTGMVAREGTEAVGAQKLTFVEHLGQYPPEPDLVEDGKELAACNGTYF